jgi:hypothetical protein
MRSTQVTSREHREGKRQNLGLTAGTPESYLPLMGTVALKTPPREARRDPLVDNPALAEAVRIGWITPAEIVSDEPPPRLPVAPLRELLQELGESRADR